MAKRRAKRPRTVKITPTLRTVGPEHDVPLGNLPAAVGKELVGLDSVQYAVLAEASGRLVGFLRYDFDAKGVLCAAGTWVKPHARKSGVAAALWRHLLKRTRASHVWVKTVTPGGRGLVTSLMREFTRFRWHVVS